MEGLKTLKAIDFYGQIAMLVLPLLLSEFLAPDNRLPFVNIAFAVGGWQVLSFLIHLTQLHKPWIARARRTYNICLLAVAAGGIIAFLTQDYLIIIYLLIFIPVATGLALAYFSLTYNEWIDIREQDKTRNDAWRPL